MSFLAGYARRLGVFDYKGAWNANTNSPALVSSVGNKGAYYIVSVAGSTNLDQITDWKPGDWCVFNGLTWEKIDNTDKVSSVNGQVGDVSLLLLHERFVLTSTDILNGFIEVEETIAGAPIVSLFPFRVQLLPQEDFTVSGNRITWNIATVGPGGEEALTLDDVVHVYYFKQE